MSLSGNNVFLVTTAIRDFWPTSKNLILLGDWCQTNSLDILDDPKAKYEVMQSPYHHQKDATSMASKEVREIYECLLPQLVNKLNLVHQLQLSERSWRIIIGPWLLFYICSVFDRLNHINQAIKLYGDFETITLAAPCFITPIDTLDAVLNLKSDFYNLQIFTKILKIKKVNTPTKVYVAKKSPSRRKSLVSQLISCISINTNKIISIFRGDVYFRHSYFPKLIEFNFFIRNLGKVLFSWHHETQTLRVNLDTQKRKLLTDLHSGNNEFDLCIKHMLPEDIPLCFIESFNVIKDKTRYYYPKRIKKIFSSNAWYWDESFKYWAAISAESGTLLYGIQHGGVYGSYQYNMSEEHELSLVDKFYSWGWQASIDKVMPLPATKLIRSIKRKADKKLKKILWVGTFNNKYFVQYPFLPYLNTEYFAEQISFVNNLSPEVLNKLVHRPHAESVALGYLDQLKVASQNLSIELWNVNFKESLESCSLFVSDHNSTTFLEALSLNIPTILFWNVNSIELKDSAKPYYNALVEQGILFSSGEDAAKAINSISDDIEGWWSVTSRQAAVKSFCNEFCNTSENAMSIWEKEILFGESV